ncbi:MAG: glycosyltransferase family 2 protein [Flavobacteriales bacterium]|nr:glycosyltransferase family 2 protein [Flavobacteriales bacterium]
MKVSIVTSVYRSQGFLREFHSRTCEVLDRLAIEEAEFIYVIDGITDDSIALLQSLKADDPRIRIIELSRNFGHHKAIMTGIRKSSGDRVFIIDCDLEEPPELLATFYEHMDSENVDAVYGVQSARKGGWGERIFGSFFYWAFNKLADVPIEKNILMARLVSRPYVDALSEFQERSLFLGGVFALVGFDQRSVEVEKGSRGESNYSFRKRLSLMIDAITSSTHRLLVYVFYLGILMSSISFIISLYYLTSALFLKEYLGGWPSLILSIWFLSGVIILCLGVVGMYISKMFIEIKQRPLTVIKQEL